MNAFALEGRVMLKDNPKAQAYYERGIERAKNGDMDTALTDFTTVIALVPNFADAYYRRGFVLLSKGDTHNCVLDYQTALRLAPDHPSASVMRDAISKYSSQEIASPFVANSPFVTPTANPFADPDPFADIDFTPAPTPVQPSVPAVPAPKPAAQPPSSSGFDFTNIKPRFGQDRPIEATPAPVQLPQSTPPSSGFKVPDGKRQTGEIEIDDSPSQGTRPNMTAQEHLARGIHLFEDQLLNGAARNFERAIQLDPMLVDAYVNLGVVYHTMKNTEKAHISFKKALELDPNHPEAPTMRAIISGNFIPGIDPSAPEPKTAREYVARAVKRFDHEDFKGAKEDFDMAFKLDPKYDEAYFQKGNMYVAQVSHRAAVAEYDKALKLNPKHADCIFARGLSRHALEDYKGAISDFTDLIKLEPKRARGYFNRGITRAKQKDHKEAIKDFTEAIKNDPKNSAAYANRGLSRLAIKEFGGARDDYDRAVEINPNEREVAALVIQLNAKADQDKKKR